MRALRRSLLRLATSIFRRRDDDRLRDEVEEHLALQTAENIRTGLSPGEARRQAVLKFGAVEAVNCAGRHGSRCLVSPCWAWPSAAPPHYSVSSMQ